MEVGFGEEDGAGCEEGLNNGGVVGVGLERGEGEDAACCWELGGCVGVF